MNKLEALCPLDGIALMGEAFLNGQRLIYCNRKLTAGCDVSKKSCLTSDCGSCCLREIPGACLRMRGLFLPLLKVKNSQQGTCVVLDRRMNFSQNTFPVWSPFHCDFNYYRDGDLQAYTAAPGYKKGDSK